VPVVDPNCRACCGRHCKHTCERAFNSTSRKARPTLYSPPPPPARGEDVTSAEAPAAPPEEARDGSGEPFTLSATKDGAVVRVVVLGNLPRDRVESMPVVELRAELAKRSLSPDGPEADLKARLLGESPWLSTCV